MILNKYTFFTSTGELREEKMEVLDERDDRFWVQDYMGAKIVSKSEIDKAVNNPLSDSIRVYTTEGKQYAASILLKEYWKYVKKIDRDYKIQKDRVVSNLAVLESCLEKEATLEER